MHWLYVMLGGALGAGGRHLVNRATLGWFGAGFPWGTLTVNLLGGFGIGLLVGILARQFGDGSGAENWRLFLGTGLLGGFTTFSAFSLEIVGMADRGQPGLAIGYAALSVGGAAAALVLGLELARAA